MAEMCSAKKNVVKHMRDDMIKAVLKLDELMIKIERKLPDIVPNLNDSHPIVKYYKDLHEMIQKVISINDEINMNL
jgi:two-component SAPR family response regulator